MKQETAATQADSRIVPFNRIVIPVEGTDREYLVQDWAIEFAAALGTPVYAVHVANNPAGPPNGVFDFLESIAARWRVSLETRVQEAGDVAEELLAELGPMDLVVLGTRRLGRRYHFGSVAESLVARAPCPVQVVRLSE